MSAPHGFEGFNDAPPARSVMISKALPIDVIASPLLPIEMLKRIRGEIATRAGRHADAASDFWSDLPPWFRRAALSRARLDPLRECMPWKSFEASERYDLQRVARELQQHALVLERITR